jgi:NCAIR mutase (PurE)-related protein
MPLNARILNLMEEVRSGRCSPEEAADQISGLRLEEIAGVARLDLGRSIRCGIPEVVLAEGKDTTHLIEIMRRYVEATGRCVASRTTPDQADAIKKAAPDLTCEYYRDARIVILSNGTEKPVNSGTVGIITAGTSDIRVAEEARIIAEEMGCRTLTAYDVGAAGIHRLFPALQTLLDADAYVVCAGREGTLPAVVAGLVGRPVIGVPVSVGYGYMGKGEAALASMLQSCAVLTVVNIDAGFTAGAFAAQIASGVQRE